MRRATTLKSGKEKVRERDEIFRLSKEMKENRQGESEDNSAKACD